MVGDAGADGERALTVEDSSGGQAMLVMKTPWVRTAHIITNT
jgi:hypothetical protein